MNIEADLIEHRPAVLAFAKRLTGGDTSAAEDLVQETYRRAWENRQGLQHHVAFRAWLNTVLRNLFFTQHRRAKWVSCTLDEIIEPSIPVRGGSGLRPRHSYPRKRNKPLYPKNWPAIAGIPIGTIKSRMHRAQAALLGTVGA